MILEITAREKTLIDKALVDAIEKLEDTARVNREDGNAGSADIVLELAAEFGNLRKKMERADRPG